MRKSVKYSPEVRERAVRMLNEHEHEYPTRWAAIESITGKIGYTAQTPQLDRITNHAHRVHDAQRTADQSTGHDR